MTLTRTNSDNSDFKKLIKQLDAILKIIDADEHSFFDALNQLDAIKNVVVCYKNQIPIGCGAFKQFDSDTVEIKRMYVSDKYRKQGVASKILSELESWANELMYSNCILETSHKLEDAIQFYKNAGYTIIPNYGSYVNVESSICFKKNFKK